MQQSHNTEQKKSTHEMFAMASQISEMEERLKDSQAADRTKAELLRQMKAEHQAELESYSHSSRLSSRQQVSKDLDHLSCMYIHHNRMHYFTYKPTCRSEAQVINSFPLHILLYTSLW